MATFKEYLEFSNSIEYKEKQVEIFNKIILSDKSIQKLQSIDYPISLLIFSEPYCPDCRAVTPFFEKCAKVNDNIKIEYLSREENFSTLSQLNKDARIPSVFYFKNSSFHIFISEFPNFIKKLMTEDPDMYDEIKYDFRTGKYNIQIEEEIINFIVSI